MAKKIKFKPDTTIEVSDVAVTNKLTTSELTVTNDDETGYLYVDEAEAYTVSAKDLCASNSVDTLKLNNVACSNIFEYTGSSMQSVVKKATAINAKKRTSGMTTYTDIPLKVAVVHQDWYDSLSSNPDYDYYQTLYLITD
jgi:hypothetical protein